MSVLFPNHLKQTPIAKCLTVDRSDTDLRFGSLPVRRPELAGCGSGIFGAVVVGLIDLHPGTRSSG
jgi:hypothetical protein